MHLRKLEEKDVPLLLEWMHDGDVNRFFRFDAASMTEESTLAFVRAAGAREDELHLACATAPEDGDEYLGTISLKEIDKANGTAAYAVAFRKKAQGTGAAAFATREILRIAFGELGLRRVYLDVLGENPRARRFYEKCGFVHEGTLRKHLCLRGTVQDLCMYGILREEFEAAKGGGDASCTGGA